MLLYMHSSCPSLARPILTTTPAESAQACYATAVVVGLQAWPIQLAPGQQLCIVLCCGLLKQLAILPVTLTLTAPSRG